MLGRGRHIPSLSLVPRDDCKRPTLTETVCGRVGLWEIVRGTGWSSAPPAPKVSLTLRSLIEFEAHRSPFEDEDKATDRSLGTLNREDSGRSHVVTLERPHRRRTGQPAISHTYVSTPFVDAEYFFALPFHKTLFPSTAARAIHTLAPQLLSPVPESATPPHLRALTSTSSRQTCRPSPPPRTFSPPSLSHPRAPSSRPLRCAATEDTFHESQLTPVATAPRHQLDRTRPSIGRSRPSFDLPQDG